MRVEIIQTSLRLACFLKDIESYVGTKVLVLMWRLRAGRCIYVGVDGETFQAGQHFEPCSQGDCKFETTEQV